MLRRAVFTCWAAVSTVALWGQSQAQIDAKSQPAVNQLAAVARLIKECPHEVESQRQWGKRPIEIERWYVGPPQNVTWDVVPGSSVRAPYLGFIEFSLPENHWVPDDIKAKFEQSEPGSSAKLAHFMGGPIKHRYEFDVGPGGLEFTKMLRGGKPEWLDDRPDDTCWQKAARDVQRMSNETPPVVLKASRIQSAGNAFLTGCDTEDDFTKQVCQLWLSGFYNGLAAAAVMVPAPPKRAAKNNLVCFPQTITDDQLFHSVLKYIRDHPQDADQPTATLALAALQEAFPCKQ